VAPDEFCGFEYGKAGVIWKNDGSGAGFIGSMNEVGEPNAFLKFMREAAGRCRHILIRYSHNKIAVFSGNIDLSPISAKLSLYGDTDLIH